jgi:16S rRNA (guanine527-N7)-methyltransferase
MASKNRAGGKPGADRASGGKKAGDGSITAGGGKKASDPVVAFPHPAPVLLEKGLETLGFPEGDVSVDSGIVRGRAASIPLFNRYIRELELFNAVFDLVGAETGSEQGRSDLVVRHILDSLSPWKEIAALAKSFAPSAPVEIADVGSGAGFPGIPLAIVFPDFHFTLVERMSKRCAFLENCVAMLALKNVTVLNSEVEKAPAGAFDIVVFRAFRPLDREMTRSLLALTREPKDGAPAGKLAAWKARRDKIEIEMNAIADEVDGWRVAEAPVPFLDHEERHLVITSSARNRCRPR